MADISQIKLPNNSTYTLKDADGRKEAYLEWGGRNFSDSYGPIDAAMVPDLGANRFAFLKLAGVSVEYSRDKGVTWIDYGSSAQNTGNLFCPGKFADLRIGKADNDNKATANGDNYQLRISIDTNLACVYTLLNKFVIFASTEGSADCTVSLEIATHGNPTAFTPRFSDVPVGGWSGYNVINCTEFRTYGNSDSQYQYLRFIFKANGGNTNYLGLKVYNLMAFGGVGWTTPSTLAKTGNIYVLDYLQNASFPNGVTATKFNGPLNGSAAKVNNHTVNADVPSGAKFTDTTDLTSMTGTLAIGHGGTGATTALEATKNLGVFSNKTGTNSGDAIPKNADLNDYTTPGVYISADSTVSKTLDNTPTTGSGFKLFVDGSYNSNYIRQFALTSVSSLRHRVRHVNGTWSDWAQIYDTENKPTKSDVGLGNVNNIYSTGIVAVKGTQTEATNAWTGNIDVPELYDGLTIAYFLPYAGTSTAATLNLTLSDGTKTGAVEVYDTGTTRMTTHMAAGSTVHLTYWSAGSVFVNGEEIATSRWTRGDYNSNTDTKVTQSHIATNYDRPFLMSANQITSTSSVTNACYRSNKMYGNPSTGLITATNFANSNGTIGASYDATTETISIIL